MDINYLPPEILRKIFSYLPKLYLLTTINNVCYYWNEVAFSRSLWQTINTTYSTEKELDIYLQNIAHYRDFVQKLLIRSDDLMKFLDIEKNRNLSNLRNLQMTNNTPVMYVGVCKNIVELYPGIVTIKLSILKSTGISGCL